MLNVIVNSLFAQAPYLSKGGKQLARTVHKAVLDRGERARNVADFLHGVWLGHPLHPVLTDITVGAWVLGSCADLVAAPNNSERLNHTADTLTTVGTLSAIPTAVSGLTDYSTIPGPAAGVGLVHALLNTLALSLYVLSMRARKRGKRGAGRLFALLGLMIASVSAYLGGHLVYDKKVGVRHGKQASEPVAWTPVMAEQELSEEKPIRVTVENIPVMLYRQNGNIYAIGAVCPHAGGPLEKGKIRGAHVQCPWHDSVFNLQNGCVVHGPTTYPVPYYETRIRDGQLEVRLAESCM